MTAKEKANHLVEMYVGLSSNKLSDYSKIEYPTAKQCALIAVDEILDVCKTYLSSYYLEVKKEIEKL